MPQTCFVDMGLKLERPADTVVYLKFIIVTSAVGVVGVYMPLLLFLWIDNFFYICFLLLLPKFCILTMQVHACMTVKPFIFLRQFEFPFQAILPPSMAEFQRLRCRVAFHSLQFRQEIQILGQRMVERYESEKT